MKKDFTIDVEVNLIARWPTPIDSPEEWERRKAVNDRLGVIACDLDEVVRVLVERQIKNDIDAPEEVPVHRRRFIPQRIRDIARQACDERYHYDLVPQQPLPTLKRVTTHVVWFQTGCAMAYCD